MPLPLPTFNRRGVTVQGYPDIANQLLKKETVPAIKQAFQTGSTVAPPGQQPALPLEDRLSGIEGKIGG